MSRSSSVQPNILSIDDGVDSGLTLKLFSISLKNHTSIFDNSDISSIGQFLLIASKIANILLERGADPNHKDDQKTPLIHFAVFNNDYESVKLLIEYNVKLKARDQYGLTPYVYALKEKNKKIVEIIKDNGGTY